MKRIYARANPAAKGIAVRYALTIYCQILITFQLLLCPVAFAHSHRMENHTMSKPRGIALVIGNGAYGVGRLRNPVNDAMAMTDTLSELGFAVQQLHNASLREMEEAINQLSVELRRGLPGLFYFAGHGVQIAGENYLIPVDARIDRQQDVRYEAMPVGRVLGAMEDAGNGLNIIVLDACRNNPLARSWHSARRGLAIVHAASGSMIAYATSPGQVTSDGHGENGLYTHHLLQHMTTPGLNIEQVFKQVRIAVMEATDGQQTPWESSSLTVDFYFVPATPGSVFSTGRSSAVASAAGNDSEITMWGMVRQSSHPEDVEMFLRAFPKGRFAPHARLRLLRLQRQVEAGETLASQDRPSASDVALTITPQAPRPERRWPKTLQNTIGMEFVLIPAGVFTMGSNHGNSDEQPAHSVRISQPFYLGKYEVTQGQWEAVMGNNPSHFSGNATLPVERVSWEDVQVFIRRLNQSEGGVTYRLPSEAEWEYAARAGSTTPFSFGEGSARLSEYAWYRRNAGRQTHPVGQLTLNAWGLHDMHGNVREWVQDWYSKRYGAQAKTDPRGATTGTNRVNRGCSWANGTRFCRSSKRSLARPDDRFDLLGFRLLKTVP